MLQAVLNWRDLAVANAKPPLLPEEILAIIWSESSGNPAAENPSDPSWGLMQVTMPIAKAFGAGAPGILLPMGPELLLQPATNVYIGAAFLHYLKSRYAARFPNGAWVAAYNEGEGNLLKGHADQAYVDAFNSHLESLRASQTP